MTESASCMTNIRCNIYDWNENLVETSVFQLLQWKHALNLELRTIETLGKPMTFKGGKRISTHLRKVLSAPRSYTVEDLRDYITESLDSINTQLGV